VKDGSLVARDVEQIQCAHARKNRIIVGKGVVLTDMKSDISPAISK
jgi:hypothetical protein